MTQHPGIWQVGRVDISDKEIAIVGWRLDLCAGRCRCHIHPNTHGLVVLEDGEDGRLGLVSYTDCDCCEPWTADELAAVVRDLQAITEMETTS